MKKVFFTAILFFCLFSFGQVTKHKIIYLDSLGIETDSANFITKRVIEDFNSDKQIYNVKEYNSKNILLLSKQVNNKQYLVLNGEYIEFHANGNKKKKLNYENYKMVGDITTWYDNGNLEMEGNYKIIDNESQLFITNFWNENAVQKVSNGQGVYVETERETKKDTLKVIGSIVNGRKNGIWKNYKEGFPIIEDVYENGKLISGKTTHSENEFYTYTQISSYAEPVEGINGFRRKVAVTMRLPEVEVSILVRTTVRFCIDELGSIKDIKFVSCPNPILNNSIMSFLQKEGKWKPSFFRGKAESTYYTLPIAVNIMGAE